MCSTIPKGTNTKMYSTIPKGARHRAELV